MIGIFDSGLGGLTVTKEVMRQLPNYQILYLGDTARAPYGNRSQELIYKFTEQAVDYLFKQGCKLIIIACNTASAEALRKIQQKWLPKHYPAGRVLGVIRPVAQEATKISSLARIGVVGTKATISSNAYIRELQILNPAVKVLQQACPLLVPLVEEGFINRPETQKIVRYYVRPLKLKNIDTLILGCTHYPMLLKQFKKAAGKNIKVFDPAVIVASSLKDYLARHPEIEKQLAKNKDHQFLVTDLTQNFANNAERWLGQKIELKKIELI
ncbi:MAG: glutamate racemase [Patescibacteria group bacterium]